MVRLIYRSSPNRIDESKTGQAIVEVHNHPKDLYQVTYNELELIKNQCSTKLQQKFATTRSNKNETLC